MLEQQEVLRVLPGSDRRIIWVPARRTLKHALFTLPDSLSGKKRASALHLKIIAWSPFEETRYSVIWSENVASVFAWDGQALDKRIIENGYKPTDCEVVPEALIRSPGGNGLRLVSCSEGIEAQVWVNGFLTASRWWADTPPENEWSLFARMTGAGAKALTPHPLEPEWLEIPWNSSQVGGTLVTQILRNERLIAAGIAVLCAPCIYFGAEWASYAIIDIGVKRETAIVEEESRAVRLQRAQALSALEVAEDLISLRRYPHQLTVLSKTHALLRPHSITLSNWDYDDGTLEFGLESDEDIDARIFISAFEEDPLFSSVSASTRGARVVMRMNLAELVDSSL